MNDNCAELIVINLLMKFIYYYDVHSEFAAENKILFEIGRGRKKL